MVTRELITVTGATGNIGNKISETLLSKGKNVRVVSRSLNKLEALVKKGAEAFAGQVDDVSSMTQAFSGSTAVFLMIPPDVATKDVRGYQNKVSETYFQAIKNSGVKNIVSLSSVGAHLPEKTGPVTGLYDNEVRLNKLADVNVLHVRPAYFMENLFMNIGLIKSMNIAGSPLKANQPMPMIATQDIAAYITERLLKLDFSGKSAHELLGPKDVTLKEVTRVLGKSINKPDLPYIEFPYDEAEKAMVQMGLSADYARLIVELNRGINEGIVKPTESRSNRNTTPTTIEDFSQIFAAAFRSA
jgi:uncharacterized protein YbjT (DUF2867 family)